LDEATLARLHTIDEVANKIKEKLTISEEECEAVTTPAATPKAQSASA
jgi:hypothetical protein